MNTTEASTVCEKKYNPGDQKLKVIMDSIEKNYQHHWFVNILSSRCVHTHTHTHTHTHIYIYIYIYLFIYLFIFIFVYIHTQDHRQHASDMVSLPGRQEALPPRLPSGLLHQEGWQDQCGLLQLCEWWKHHSDIEFNDRHWKPSFLS